MRSHFLLASVALCFFVVAAGSAHADDAKGARDAAVAHYKKGEQHYNLGRFEEALDSFSKAYEIEPAPRLLFNIGQCHRQLKRYERALFFYENYLRERPSASNRQEVEELIAATKKLLEDARRIEEAAEREARERADARAADDGAAQVSEANASASPEVEPPEESPVYTQPWVWGVTGGAALAVVVAVGVSTAVAIAILSTPPAPSGSLGTHDLRGAAR